MFWHNPTRTKRTKSRYVDKHRRHPLIIILIHVHTSSSLHWHCKKRLSKHYSLENSLYVPTNVFVMVNSCRQWKKKIKKIKYHINSYSTSRLSQKQFCNAYKANFESVQINCVASPNLYVVWRQAFGRRLAPFNLVLIAKMCPCAGARVGEGRGGGAQWQVRPTHCLRNAPAYYTNCCSIRCHVRR